MARIPIAVNLESIDGTLSQAKIVNGFAEFMKEAEKVYSRPAMTLAQGSFAAFGQGMAFTPAGQLFVVSGGDIYIPVPGHSISALSTVTAASDTPLIPAVLNGVIHAIDGTNGTVYHSVSPYTAWSSAGTVTGAGVRSHVAYGGKLWAQGGTVVSTSQNGTSWGALANHPPLAGRLVGFQNALYCYPTGIGTDTVFYRTLDGGASAWGTLTANFSGTAIASAAYGADFSKIVALGGTRAAVTFNGTGWTNVSNNIGFAFGDSSIASTPAILNGVTYAFAGTSTLFASSNVANWNSLASVAFNSAQGKFPLAINGNLYGLLDSSPDYRLYRLTSDGTLQGVSASSTIGAGEGEISSIIGTESGLGFVKVSSEAYTISSAGVFTKVTDANYPAITVRGAVYLNGHLYVMEPDGTIWNSAEDDFTQWAGTDFITAEFEADGGVCLAKHGEYVVALGQFTTEAFYDAGNATGSPLAPVQNAPLLIGCAHANSVAQIESRIMWVAQQKGQGSTFHKGRFVVVMGGYGAYDRISTSDVERILDADDFSSLYADVLTIAGHVFYVLSLLDSNVTLVYDFTTKLWHEWSLSTVKTAVSVASITQVDGLATATVSAGHGFSDGDQVTIAGAAQAGYNLTINVNVTSATVFTYPVAAATVSPATGTITATGYSTGALDISASCYFDNEQLVQLRTTGDVYVLDVTGTSDNGAPIDFHIRTQEIDAGNNREKFQGDLDVVGDKVSSTGLIRYTDDSYTSYTKYKRVDLSLRRPRVRRGGTFSQRAIEFRHTLSAKVGITALEPDIEQGA